MAVSRNHAAAACTAAMTSAFGESISMRKTSNPALSALASAIISKARAEVGAKLSGVVLLAPGRELIAHTHLSREARRPHRVSRLAVARDGRFFRHKSELALFHRLRHATAEARSPSHGR
jgi:hypothetical protein